ncbi:MAG: hypothetical protein EHM20_16110 [Alphaproteobacteria bacterium]|nr:MAG: hypothetical protein EHM20_16110 [Alphaproteobacteria bacterium]
MNKLTVLVLAFLLLTSVASIGTAAEIIIKPGDSIQDSINNAAAHYTIIQKQGTYTENIKVLKDGLTIRSESGNSDDTIIKAKNSSANTLLLQADNITINGFKIIGATDYSYSGICLSSCSNCVINNNKLMGNAYGIYVLHSEGNMVSKNTATKNGEYGIVLGSSTGNVFSGNTASNNSRGIHFGNSDGNTLSGNTVRDNSVYGLYVCPRSDRNLIFNNYFNNTNITIKNGIGNAYNTRKTAGTNIVGGSYIGGNFWAKPDGTGFSQTSVDKNGDGIADPAYTNITGSIYSDYLPLVVSK